MSASSKTLLDDEQMFALMKFKRNLKDTKLPKQDDQYLLRWLRARQWNPEAAEKMLRQSLQWRQQWEVDTSLKTWKPPEPLVSYIPWGLTGYDRDKAPVVVVPFAGFDIWGLLHSASRQDLVRAAIQIIEGNLDLADKTGIRQVTVIFDMDGFNLRQYAWRPASEVIISLIQMYEANYPEILKACFIINAPRVFAIAFGVVKKFLNEYTLGKIQIFPNDPKKWKKVLSAHIDGDSLPKHYGGNLEDPDGNAKYITKVKQGGKVPKSYYSKKIDDANLEEDKKFATAVIKKGDKLNIDFIVAEDGCFLRWDFRTEGHDIRFGISCKDAEGNISPVVRHRRIAAHQMNESGVVACQAPATYTVTFDNSYSLLRSKKLHYCVYVTYSVTKITENLSLEDASEDEKTVENGSCSNENNNA